MVQVGYQSLAFADTFSSSPVDIHWSDGERLTTTTGIDYLGDFTTSDELHLILGNLPPHRRVTVSFDLYTIGAWEGNGGAPVGLWQFGQAGQPALLSTTFCNEPTCLQAYPLDYPDGAFAGGEGAVGVDELGYQRGEGYALPSILLLLPSRPGPGLAVPFHQPAARSALGAG